MTQEESVNKIFTVEIRDDRGAWHIRTMCKTMSAAEESKAHFASLHAHVRIMTYRERGDRFFLDY